jgi:RNA polymerase sigma factor (sigma-70 family)
LPTEDSLVLFSRRIAAGDLDAFAAFYRAWFGRSVDLVHRATKLDRSDCMDVVQGVMVRAADRMPAFESEIDGERWLRRVLVNAARDRLRSELRRRGRERRSAETRGESVDAPSAASADEVDRLRRQLERLERDAADLLYRRFALGWTLEQIAHELGMRTGAVDGRIRRILGRLRAASEAARDGSKRIRDEPRSEELP